MNLFYLVKKVQALNGVICVIKLTFVDLKLFTASYGFMMTP